MEWACAAASKIDAMRLRPEYIHLDVARACERAGMTDEAARRDVERMVPPGCSHRRLE